MKKSIYFLLVLLIALSLVGCGSDNEDDDNNQNSDVETPVNPDEGEKTPVNPGTENQNPETGGTQEQTEAFRLSSISDITDSSATRTYIVFAPYTDTFTIEAKTDNISNIVISENNDIMAQDADKITIDLVKNQVYSLAVETTDANASFELHTEAINNLITYPYDVENVLDVNTIDVETNADALIEYNKRPGGTYVYSNNPELIPSSSVGTAFIKTPDLTGDVFFTFEHANSSGDKFYLGYQLKNEGDTDVYITVTNIGYQEQGSWFGQLAWYDYYNTSFKLPDDYLNANGSISSKYSGYDYAYSDYKPRVFQPITYRLPAGEYFYVIGGTTRDAYNNINVDETANLIVPVNKCANGNVKFNVTGGSVTGTFYCYKSIAQVQAEPEAVGYRLDGYAQQYVGTAAHKGVIDSNITWAFDDTNTTGVLPVTYSNAYDKNSVLAKNPYTAYKNKEYTYTGRNSWLSHLNPQNEHMAIGTDLVEFTCVDEEGNNVVIDNNHADGSGKPANTANWMIEYQENYTLINRGSTDRTVTLYKKDGGTLAMFIKDSKTGEVIDTYYTIGQAVTGYSFAYPVNVPANSTVQITLCYVLVACSYGNVTHWAKLS